MRRAPAPAAVATRRTSSQPLTRRRQKAPFTALLSSATAAARATSTTTRTAKPSQRACPARITVYPMQLSSIRRLMRLLVAASLAVLTTSLAYGQIGPGGVPGRLVDIVEVTDHDEQVDISVQFNCSVRYVTHLPASE